MTHAKLPQLGEQELELLRFVSDHAPVSVRDAATLFGEPNGLARTTVLTMMERLRKKDFLVRSHISGGTYQYSPVVAKSQLMHDLVRNFVERTLGGSLDPLVSYLADSLGLSEPERADLERLVQEIDQEG